MKHFSVAAWADFERGLASEDEVGAMGAHLGSCADCKDIARFLNKMATFSRRMAGESVPAAAVRLAKSIFPSRTAKSKKIRPILAQLIFDSRISPALAGTRSTWKVG